jgi:murein DD-endopeptidase MepM/ murein hydrolase activator NlpD
MQVRQYVGNWTSALSQQNASLHKLLRSSAGLPEQVFNIINRPVPAGGLVDSPITDPLLGGEFATETERNRQLRDTLRALPARMPLDDFRVSSPFGIRNHPIHGRPALHTGVDLIPTSSDLTVRAVKAGTVIVARYHPDLGNTVVIRHDRGIETVYGHLASFKVREGDQVAQGAAIGVVGNTGASTGTHLHFEVLVGSYHLDPYKVIETVANVFKTKD